MDKFHLFHDLLTSLHFFYLKIKHTALVCFLLILFFTIFNSTTAFSEGVVAKVYTPVKINYDHKEKNMVVTQNTIAGALEQAGISVGQYDITEPPSTTLLTGQDQTIEVVRALPVLISDNNQEHLAYSAYTKAQDILKQLKIEIFPEDKISSELILDPADENAIGQKVIIERAPVYNIEVDGGVKIARSWSKEVKEVVTKSGIQMGPQDQVSPNYGAILIPGQTIVVTRINEFDTSVDESVPFETIYQGNASIPFGQKRVTQEGVNGLIKKTYHVIYKNGQEVSRWLVGSESVTPKQNKIISSGIITGRANFGYYSGMVTSFYKGMTGRYLLVTNLSNGKQVKVKIIGSGPFNGPILDMGTEPFQAIGGSISSGFIPKVSVQLVD